tara:strand:- start:1615 stop:1956 length:342 start_codon:yes stop_codon:yes gene_type:complete
MGGKTPMKIRSFTLCERSILKLKKYATEEHKGNQSIALRHLLLSAIATTLDDYAHHAPEEARNWLGSGKCNPRLKGYPCVICWGENATVNVKNALIERDGKWIEERVINVENA